MVYKALDNLGAYPRWFGFQPDPKLAVLFFGMTIRQLTAAWSMTVFVLALPIGLAAHPEGHGLTVGEVTSVKGDTFELKTAKATLTVKITGQTKFERDNRSIERIPLQKGTRVGVEATKSENGETVAKRIVVGLPAAGKH